jgi:hypothetical protein
MDYKTKYLKYKTKYLNLSRKIQTGGTWNSVNNKFFGYGTFYKNSENNHQILVLGLGHTQKTYLRHFTEDYKYITKYNETIDISGLYDFTPRPIVFDIGSDKIDLIDSSFDLVRDTDKLNELKKKLIEQIFDGYKYIYNKLTENGETMFPIYNENILLFSDEATKDMYIKIIPVSLKTSYFKVPEYIVGMEINEKTCVFNLGTLFYFILSENIHDEYEREKYKKFIDNALGPITDLTLKMLSRDPNDRPTFDIIHNIIHTTHFSLKFED